MSIDGILVKDFQHSNVVKIFQSRDKVELTLLPTKFKGVRRERGRVGGCNSSKCKLIQRERQNSITNSNQLVIIAKYGMYNYSSSCRQIPYTFLMITCYYITGCSSQSD